MKAALIFLAVLCLGVKQVPVQKIVISQPLEIKPINGVLCEEYSKLFMEALHESLPCSEDQGVEPLEEERCEELFRKLRELSALRSRYCYGDPEDGC